MPQSETQSKAIVVLPPPILSQNKLSNRYKAILDIKWGELESQIEVSQEEGAFMFKLTEAINKALAELSEQKPYILK